MVEGGGGEIVGREATVLFYYRVKNADFSFVE